ncbi:MAG: hypothetical protein JWN62_3269 [Acidimicrobiales bacterium]|nr:hypothetical protein [Acidimicrobiales bacterium]
MIDAQQIDFELLDSFGPVADADVGGPPPPRRPLFGFRWPANPSTIFWILITVSIVSLWCVFFAVVLSPVQEHRSQRNLYAEIRSHLVAETVPTGGDIPAGTPIALLQVPAIGLHDVVVVEGTTASNLQNGPGHRRDTPMPGQAGVSVIMGRSLLFGAPFADIGELQTGALMTVTTGQGTFNYRVDSLRRPGELGPPAVTATAGRLTLITSEGVGKGLDATRQPLYLDATLLGPVQSATAVRPTTVDSSETTMSGDTSSLPDLIVWLLALIAAVIGGQWLQGRWGRRQAALVCIPVVLALLWLAAESASQLLPNLM